MVARTFGEELWKLLKKLEKRSRFNSYFGKILSDSKKEKMIMKFNFVAGIYLFKVNNVNTKIMCEIFIVKFEQISHII